MPSEQVIFEPVNPNPKLDQSLVSYWKDKVVLVTGGSAGFGKVLATELAAAKSRVIILSRGAESLDNTKAEIESQYTDAQITTQILDVTSPEKVQQTIPELLTQFQRIDAVFNCVGKSTREQVIEADAAKMSEMLNVNLNSVVNMTRATLPELQKSGGHIINIGSLASKTAWPFVTSYAVSKSAMATYTHQLRLEGPANVHFMLVCPGPIRRADTGSRYDDQSKSLPEEAKSGGAGAKLKGIDPHVLSQKILRASAKRKKELIVPGYARIAFIASAISPTLGDWLLRRKMSH